MDIQVRLRMDRDTFRCLQEIADRLYKGNRSKAIRECLAIGMCTLCSNPDCPRRRLSLEEVVREAMFDLGSATLKLTVELKPKTVEKPLIYENSNE